MKIDLCKLLGVEEGEEFKLSKSDLTHRINNNKLEVLYEGLWGYTAIAFNKVATSEITKLPKKKEFTDDELVIMRNFPSGFDWITRDKSGNVYIFEKKPSKNEYGCWGNGDDYCILVIFNHLFQSILWEDEEPVYIDDYVKR